MGQGDERADADDPATADGASDAESEGRESIDPDAFIFGEQDDSADGETRARVLFDEVLDRIDARRDLQDSGGLEDADHMSDLLGSVVADLDADASEPGEFDDLLERVEQRERADTRAGTRRSDRFDIGEIPGASQARTILLVGSLGSEPDDETCRSTFDLLDLSEQRVLLVSLARRGPTRLDHFLEQSQPADPAAIAHVCRGGSKTGDTVDTFRTASVMSPEDLTHLGISISMIVADWAESPEQVTICFHSLSTLLEYVSERRAFRFLHVLLGRLDEAGARIHVHLDRDAHERHVIALYRELFDMTVEVTDDGLEVLY